MDKTGRASVLGESSCIVMLKTFKLFFEQFAKVLSLMTIGAMRRILCKMRMRKIRVLLFSAVNNTNSSSGMRLLRAGNDWNDNIMILRKKIEKNRIIHFTRVL